VTEFAQNGFWFFLGFVVAAWLSYKDQERRKRQIAASFLQAKNEVIRILNAVKEMTEITVTIRDETGELTVESEGKPAKPAKDLH
jgi:DNA-binding transcriptional regulator LsrR (DeoR family)